MCTTGTGEPYTPNQPRIADRCPSCGGQTLFIGAGGWLTCSVIGCKAPGAASDWLRDADATRAKLAEVERERDAAVERAYWHGSSEALVDTPWGSVEGVHKALAASQAREARLREALEERGEHGRKCPWAHFSAGRPKDGGGYEMLYREAWYEVRPDDKRPACTCGLNAALASAPGSTDALRAMLKEAATEGINEGYGNGLSYGTERIEAIVSRILVERSDDAPQGRGERAKEDGDA